MALLIECPSVLDWAGARPYFLRGTEGAGLPVAGLIMLTWSGR